MSREALMTNEAFDKQCLFIKILMIIRKINS